MTKEIGPREQQLREFRERRHAERHRPMPVIAFTPSAETLKALGAKIESTKPKARKPKKGKRNGIAKKGTDHKSGR